MRKEFYEIPDLRFNNWNDSYMKSLVHGIFYLKDQDNIRLFNACFGKVERSTIWTIQFVPVSAVQMQFYRELRNNINNMKIHILRKQFMNELHEIGSNTVPRLERFYSEFKSGNWKLEGYEELKHKKLAGYPCYSVELYKDNRLVYSVNSYIKKVTILGLIGHYEAKYNKDLQDKYQEELINTYNSYKETVNPEILVRKLNDKYN